MAGMIVHHPLARSMQRRLVYSILAGFESLLTPRAKPASEFCSRTKMQAKMSDATLTVYSYMEGIWLTPTDWWPGDTLAPWRVEACPSQPDFASS
eukprot:6480113-Amphidinium_carterae.3